MKTFIALVALATVALATTDVCEMKSGRMLRPYKRGGKVSSIGFMDIPCKFIAVNQQCGSWKVKLVPGSSYVAPNFFQTTMWMEFMRLSDKKSAEGRIWTKSAVKFLNDKRPDPFRYKRGELQGEDVFYERRETTAKGQRVVVLEAKNGDFNVTFGPYDPSGIKQRNIYFKFECFRDDTGPDFPAAFCGNREKQWDVYEYGEPLGWAKRVYKKGNFRGWKTNRMNRTKTYYHALLSALTTDQTPNPSCTLASNALAACPSMEMQGEAIDRCHRLLSSKNHRKCASLYTCDIMKTFAECITTVCNGFNKSESCNNIGDAIDMCRRFPDLSEKLNSTCYKGLFIELEPVQETIDTDAEPEETGNPETPEESTGGAPPVIPEMY